MGIAMQAFDTLTEFCQGPCPANQVPLRDSSPPHLRVATSVGKNFECRKIRMEKLRIRNLTEYFFTSSKDSDEIFHFFAQVF